MKKFISKVLIIIMLLQILPVITIAEESSLCFTWAWDKNTTEKSNEAWVVSWQGGSYASYRSSFVVFDMPENFKFDILKTNVKADFTINSATLNNGGGQAPTAAVVLVNGDKVKEAYATTNGDLLKEQKENGVFLGTYKIDATPQANALKNIDLTDYFLTYPDATSVGIYLTNLASDGYQCAGGIASAMTDFDLALTVTEDALSNYIELCDEEGNVLDTIYVRGESGDEFNVSDFVDEVYYRNGIKYILKEVDTDTFSVKTDPEGVHAVYQKSDEKGLFYPATRSGYSGGVSETGILVATGSTDYATAERAPSVSGVSHQGGSATLGAARVGVIEFEVDASVDPSSINDAKLNFYVKKVHANLYAKWMRLAVFQTENPDIDEYSLGGMDYNLYPASGNDYSENAVFWSNEQISSSSTGWKTVDIRKIIVDALDEGNKSGNNEKIKIVLRLQVPTAGLYIASTQEANAPFINITTSSDHLLACYDFENLTPEGRAEDITSNGYDALLLGDAKIENGSLVLNGNGAAQIDYEDFRTQLDSYTIVTNVTISGDAVSNTRIYDFGANAGNSAFLRVKGFCAGMKYNDGATVFAGKNMGNITPFEKADTKYHIAVTYDSASSVTKVFVNGDQVVETSDIKHGLDDFSDSTPNNFIGRTNWYGTGVAKDNPDIKASYDDFAVFTAALDERIILTLYNPDFEDDVKNAAVEIAEIMDEYISSPVEEDLPFDTAFITENGDVFDVEWFTSDDSIVNTKGNVFRGVKDLSCDVYAVVSCGEYKVTTKTMTVTIKAISTAEIEESLILRHTFDYDGNEIFNYNRANLSENNVVKLPDDINVGVTDYTVAAYVRCDDLTRNGQRIYDFGMENGTVNGNYYAFCRVNSDGTLTVGINNGGSTQSVTSAGSIHEGEWTHVAIVYSSSSGETYIYINGVLDSKTNAITNTMGGATKDNHSYSNYIGRSQWYLTQSSANPDFVGKVDNFEFYSSALSATVIESLMEKGYNSPEVEIVSAAYVKGMNKAVVNISSSGYEGEAKIIAASYNGHLESVSTTDLFIEQGLNSVSVEFDSEVSTLDNLKCFLLDSLTGLTPLGEGFEIDKIYEFSYDWKYPDNHLLSNEFSLKAYDGEKYLSLANSVSMSEWTADDTNLLWTAPFEYNKNAEGYYPLRNVDGTYLSLDTGSIKTGKVNNWRFIQIDPELVDGKNNVYAVLQRSSGKYLARDNMGVTGASDYENETAWWELDIVNYDEVSRMFTSPGFLGLSTSERARIYGVTSQAMWPSSNRRGKLKEYMGSNYFDKSKEDQAEALRKIFDYKPSNQVNRSITTATTGAHGTYELGEITGSANYKGKDGEDLWAYKGVATYYTDNTKTEIEQTVTIYGRNANVIKNIAKGFSYIPYQYRKYITNIRDYYHTANQFNCGAKDMYVRTSYEVSAEGFATTAAHEVGHSLSGSWGWVCNSSRYTNAINSDINRVSGYGSSNNSEDFAEFVQFAVSCTGDKELLRELKVMFPARFNLLRTVLREMNGGVSILDDVE